MQYETEEQQVEAMKAWWNENGKAVILGIVIGALLVVGWMWWKSHQENIAVSASDNFSQTLEAVQNGEHDKVEALASAAKDEHAGTIYSAYTAMAAARSAIEQDDLETGATHLQWVVDNSELDEVGIIARVRLARVKAAQDDVAGGLGVLPENYSDVFTHLVEEVRGDLHVASGDTAAAKAAYQAAIDSGKSPDSEALTMKINELASVGGDS